jgi:hypothetical protein
MRLDRCHRTAVMGQVDPRLPRYGTDFIDMRVVMREIDPTLPRYGTDFIDTASPDARPTI